jgi:putative cell wall-binding protein
LGTALIGTAPTVAQADPIGGGAAITVYATSQPAISAATAGQAAGNWVVAVPIGTAPGAYPVTLTVNPPTGANCTSPQNVISFGSTPTLTVGVDAITGLGLGNAAPILPTISVGAAIAPDGGVCAANSGINDVLSFTFTVPAGGLNAVADIVISNVTYNVGSALVDAADANPLPVVVTPTGAAAGPGCGGGARVTPGASFHPGQCGVASNALLNNNIAEGATNFGPTNSWTVAAIDPAIAAGNSGATGAAGAPSQTAPLGIVSGASGGQAVNGWTISVPDDFGTGDNIILVLDPGGAGGFNSNCSTNFGNLGFAAVPTVTVNANGDAPAFNPQVTVTNSRDFTKAVGATIASVNPTVPVIPDAGCASVNVNNELVIGAQNAGPTAQPGPSTAGSNIATRPNQVLTISGVKFTATGNVPKGPVTITAYAVPTSVGSTEVAPKVDPSSWFTTANAVVFHGVVSGPATPPTIQVAGAQAIGNLTFTETQNGDVPTGQSVCFQIITPGVFWHTTSTTPTVTVDSTSGAAAGSPATSPANTAILSFNVTKASSNGPATFTVNGTSVDVAANTKAGFVVMFAGLLAGNNCVPPSAGNLGNFPLNNVGDGVFNGFAFPPPGVVLIAQLAAGVVRLQGSDRDATASAILNAENPCAVGGTGTNQFIANNNPVVLAVDNNFPDALSAQYLAGQLGTGILLTKTDVVPDTTLAALKQNGAQTIFIVGGPNVISQAVINQLLATQAFVCGGTGPRLNSSGQPVNLNVHVLAGPNRYDTNLAVNTFFPAGTVGAANFTTNAFNPAWRTAILSTGANFPDALAAGAISSEEIYPIILTDPATLSQQAINTIEDLGIQQVIVVGGPVAVAQSVVTAVQALSTMKVVFQVYGAERTATAACLAALNASQANAGVTDPLSNATGANGAACVDPGGSTSPLGKIWRPDNTAPNGDNWPFVGLARADIFPDALTSGPYLGFFNDAPLLLASDPNTLGSATTTFMQVIGRPTVPGRVPISGLVVFGGPFAVSDATVNAAVAALST